jgi:hypothetical protein
VKEEEEEEEKKERGGRGPEASWWASHAECQPVRLRRRDSGHVVVTVPRCSLVVPE